MANTAAKYKYTGETFTAPNGNDIFKGMAFTVNEWEHFTGISYHTISTRRARFIKQKKTKQESINMALNWKPAPTTLQLNSIHIYHGNGFTAKTGRKVVNGEIHALAEWLIICGMELATFTSRWGRLVTKGVDDKFSPSISKPVRKQKKALGTIAAPLGDSRQKVVTILRVARQGYLVKRRKEGVKMSKILECRAIYQEMPCSPCQFKMLCYGEARA